MTDAISSNNSPITNAVVSHDEGYEAVVTEVKSLVQGDENKCVTELQKRGAKWEETFARTNVALYYVMGDIFRLVKSYDVTASKEVRQAFVEHYVSVCKELGFTRVTAEDKFASLVIKAVFGKGTDRRRFYIYNRAIELLQYVTKGFRNLSEETNFDVVAYFKELGGIEEAKWQLAKLKSDAKGESSADSEVASTKQQVKDVERALTTTADALATVTLDKDAKVATFENSDLAVFVGRRVGDVESKTFEIVFASNKVKRDWLDAMLKDYVKDADATKEKADAEATANDAETEMKDAINEAKEEATNIADSDIVDDLDGGTVKVTFTAEQLGLKQSANDEQAQLAS